MKKYRIIRRESETRTIYYVERKIGFWWTPVFEEERGLFEPPISFWKIEDAENFLERLRQPRVVKQIDI